MSFAVETARQVVDLWGETGALGRGVNDARKDAALARKAVEGQVVGSGFHRTLVPHHDLVLVRITEKISAGKFRARRLDLSYTSLADMAEDPVDYRVVEAPWEQLFVGARGIAAYFGEFTEGGAEVGFYLMLKSDGGGMPAKIIGSPTASVYPFEAGTFLGMAGPTGSARIRDSKAYDSNSPLRRTFAINTPIVVHWDPNAGGGIGEFFFHGYEDPQWGACP